MIDGLSELAKDADPGIRYSTAYSLAEICHPNAERALQLLSQDETVTEWGRISDEAKRELERLRNTAT